MLLVVFARLAVIALALLVASHLLPGIEIDSLYAAAIAALIIGLLNITIKPLLVIFTLPLTLLTLGLFTFVINAGLFLFVASFVEGFQVESFLSALAGSLIVSLFSTLASRFIK